MKKLLDTYRTITLAEMKGIKLMNRIDTKFVTSIPQLTRLLTMAHDQYLVQQTDGLRLIPYATLYLDTPGLDMYNTHHCGHLPRQKVRLRSYVASQLSFIEVKTKDNHRRTSKKRIEWQGYTPGKMSPSLRFTTAHMGKNEIDFVAQHLNMPTAHVLPQLENSFNRITLVNQDRTERVTIDTSLRFHNFASGHDCDLAGLAIIELKRDSRYPSPILEMLRQLRIMPMGFSKYCMGTALTRDDVRKGRFKERLRTIQRILHN